MSKSFIRQSSRLLVAGVAFFIVSSASVFAQSGILGQAAGLAHPLEVAAALPAAPSASARDESPVPAATGGAMMGFISVQESPKQTETHVFWDRENKLLFAAVAASATADFFTTHANLANGGRELNPVARVMTSSTPLLATNFALETAGTVGISYFFHKTGHHTLERMTSFVDIGGSVGAVTYGLTHR
jgi:hypothetical protein